MLTNFSGGRTAWPIYMTIGNIHSRIRNSASNNAWILVALLPVPPSCSADNAAQLREYQDLKANNLHSILRNMLGDETSPRYRGVDMRCADGNARVCYLKVCGWIADYQEYMKLYNLEGKGCPVCEVPADKLGDYYEPPPRDEWEVDRYGNATPRYGPKLRNFEEYTPILRELKIRVAQKFSTPQHGKQTQKDTIALNKTIREKKAELHAVKIRAVDSALWHLGFEVPVSRYDGKVSGFELSMFNAGTLWKPDMLHTMYQGLFKHIMDWIMGFLKRHKLAAEFDKIWKSIPPYPGLIAPKKGYR